MQRFDIIVIGGGVSGTALVHVLTNYTNVKRILLLEKHEDFAQVSSHYTQNSQTLHFGDIETHYDYEKAISVNKKTGLLRNYIEGVGKKDKIFIKKEKMVIGVGKAEAIEIRERYNHLKKHFPKIKLLERDEIRKHEPKVIEGRGDEEIVALWSPDGYIMNYYELSRSFIKNLKKKGKEVKINLGEEVRKIDYVEGKYVVRTFSAEYECDFLVCDAGAMSMRFAKDLGYGEHLTVMSLAGNFYRAPECLKGKVYTWQNPKRPNAALHGDADIIKNGYTRFGPTAKVLLMLERRNYKSVWDYFKVFNYSLKGWSSIFKVGFDPDYFFYMLKNYLIEIPFLGKMILARDVRKIVPTIKWYELKKEKGYGATRPQLIDTHTGEIALGEARIEGKNAIFNVTPSPGASTCLANAERDVKEIVKTLGKLTFDEKKFKKDFGSIP